MFTSALYDEAFGPSNPHTITYHEDFSWQDDLAWDDDITTLITSVVSDPDRAAALHTILVGA